MTTDTANMTIKQLQDYKSKLTHKTYDLDKRIVARAKSFSPDIETVYNQNPFVIQMKGGAEIRFLDGYKFDITINIYSSCPSTENIEVLQAYMKEKAELKVEALRIAKLIFKDFLGREARTTNLD
jgi:hypothetical protein